MDPLNLNIEPAVQEAQKWLHRAIEIATENVDSGGGPFGAVVVRNGISIAEGVNLVTATQDPTAHAEVTAIRMACSQLETFDLSDCTIYASCEPCPMCLGAIYWARLQGIWFAASRFDAADAGFDDEFIYRELAADVDTRKIPVTPLKVTMALDPFIAWSKKHDKIRY